MEEYSARRKTGYKRLLESHKSIFIILKSLQKEKISHCSPPFAVKSKIQRNSAARGFASDLFFPQDRGIKV